MSMSQEQINVDLFDQCKRLQKENAALDDQLVNLREKYALARWVMSCSLAGWIVLAVCIAIFG